MATGEYYYNSSTGTGRSAYININAYTCAICGQFVYGYCHNCYSYSPHYPWNISACEHCLCQVGEPGVHASDKNIAHKKCCHCGKSFKKGKK